jgi:hypothetical protein
MVCGVYPGKQGLRRKPHFSIVDCNPHFSFFLFYARLQLVNVKLTGFSGPQRGKNPMAGALMFAVFYLIYNGYPVTFTTVYSRISAWPFLFPAFFITTGNIK